MDGVDITDLSQSPNTTVGMIRAHYEQDVSDWRRPHLGASQIGKPCSRDLWFGFRWATKPDHEGRILRLFERGQREEVWLADDLRAIGVDIQTVDPTTITKDNPEGDQFHFSALGGHYAGSCDGLATKFVEAPKAVHVFECKTANKKIFELIQKHGCEKQKPEHYAQMQTYMGYFWKLGYKTDRAFYFVVCKDNDEIYAERIHLIKKKAEIYTKRAKLIIESKEPLSKISDNPSWWQCKFCDHKSHCQMEEVESLERNCRTCADSTPEPDGTWSCAFHKTTRSVEEQRSGCGDHVFIPALLPWKVVEYDPESRSVFYRDHSGATIVDGNFRFTVGEA